MKAFILAGGFATRLWPLTDTRPKPLLPIAGKPLLSYIVEQIPSDIPVTVSTNAVFRPTFEEWQTNSIIRPVKLVVESAKNDEEKLGALGALAEWIRSECEVPDDVLLVTGDNYFGFSIADFIKEFKPGITLIAAYDIGDKEKASAFGTIVTEQSTQKIRKVLAFEEKPAEPRTSLVSTGCTIIPREHIQELMHFAALHPDNVGAVFEEFLRRNIPVQCAVFTGHWFDVGSFHSYMEATKTLVERGVFHGEGCSVDTETTCEGSVVVGPGTSIRRSTLKNVVILEGGIVEDCRLEDCVIDHHCILRGVELTGKILMAETRMEEKKSA